MLGSTPCNTRSISLSGLTQFTAAAVKPALYQLTLVNDLNLRGTLSQEVINLFTPALQRMISMSSFFVSGLTPVGATALAPTLSQWININYLCFGSQMISSRELGFDTGVGTEGLTSLASAIKTLKLVDVVGLRIQNIPITEAAASAVADMLPALTYNWLNFIYLTSCQITDRAVTILASGIKVCPGVQLGNSQLDLSYNQIGDDGVIGLFLVLKTIPWNTVSLSNNQIGDNGAATVAQAFSQGASITHLYLQNNRINNTGADSLIAAFRNPAIKLPSNCYLVDNLLTTGKKAQMKTEFPTIYFGF